MNKMTSISQTLNQPRKTFSLFISKHNSCIASAEDKAGFWSDICEFMIDIRPYISIVQYLKHSRSNGGSYGARIYCLSCNFLPQELERLPFILKDHTLLH